MEELLDLAELAVAADERRLEALRLERARAPGDDAQRTPQRRLALLALELERAGVLEDDRLLGGAARRLADEHGPGLGDRLHARRGVDEIAGDHPLPGRAERDGGFPGEHARARLQVLGAELFAERADSGDEVERRAHRALRVVLGRDRRAPDRHHGVADELLDRAAVELDQPPARVEVAREKLAHLLRVARLGERREADEVGEEHRDEPPLGGRDSGRRRRRRGASERRAAVAAEALAGRVRGAATRAGLAPAPCRMSRRTAARQGSRCRS